ncbi:MAG: protein kinase [Planctomycetota bacterium]
MRHASGWPLSTSGRARARGQRRWSTGWDPERGEDVAVKVLTELDGKKRKRFATEVRTLARLRHPHLVTILAYGEHQGHPYLVMELRWRVAARASRAARSMSPGRAVELTPAPGAGRGLRPPCAVIHRDIKPRQRS